MPIDYSVEAARYDTTRGGEQRARVGHQVAVTDLIIEMLRHAQARLHGAAACMDARNLPQAEASDFFRSRVGPKRIARSPGGRSGDW